MKYVFTGLFLLFFMVACTTNQELANDDPSSADVNAKPIDIVNSRMQAYNDHDLAKFLSVYIPLK